MLMTIANCNTVIMEFSLERDLGVVVLDDSSKPDVLSRIVGNGRPHKA